MISLIMLNWERPHFLLNSISHYLGYKSVGEIIVFNNNKNYNFKGLGNSKLTVIESSRDMGLYTRLAASGLAKYKCILHCDDDILIPEHTINELYKKWLARPDICHGIHGRMVGSGYDVTNAFGRVHVVLTRCVLVSKQSCLLAYLLTDALPDMKAVPHGNGEDIILSMVAMKRSGLLNMCYRLPYYDYKESANHIAISKRWSNHIEHRTQMVKACSRILRLKL